MSDPTMFDTEIIDRDRVESSAVISGDGVYRYQLHRRWADGNTALWIMLNPSTADAHVDDPTIRRCVSFSNREGCGALTVVNLYALRATNPKELLTHPDPCGPLNWLNIEQCLNDPANGVIIAAWGSWKGQRSYARTPADGFRGQNGPLANRNVKCLGVTSRGYPRHPLYVRADQPLVAWPS